MTATSEISDRLGPCRMCGVRLSVKKSGVGHGRTTYDVSCPSCGKTYECSTNRGETDVPESVLVDAMCRALRKSMGAGDPFRT